MIVYPNAKINLGLKITAKREDGFHDLESIFLPTGFCDILEVQADDAAKGPGISLECSGIKIEGREEDNLVVRAYNMIAEEYKLPAVKIALHKQIPSGGGLGGGSSNGAFMLKALDELFELRMSNKVLKEYAARLGSDCPFFIDNVPALVTGRGEIIEKLDRGTGDMQLVIISPGLHISTAWAYSMIRPAKTEISFRDALNTGRDKWKNLFVNDFEETAFKKHPVLKEIRDKLYSLGAFYASMTGSGSAIYGMFEEETDIKNAFPAYQVWSGRREG